MNVLIAEDDPTSSLLLRKSLEKLGHNVVATENGKEAWQKVSQPDGHDFHLLITDWMMPEMDGFDFAENLRKDLRWRDIPVVVVTAKDLTEEDRQRLSGYVEKIIVKGSALSQESLLAEVSQLVESRVSVTEKNKS